MIKGILLKPIKKILREILIEIIQEERDYPVLEKLKEVKIIKSGKFTIYDAMERNMAQEIVICVRYVDILTKASEDTRYKFNSISSFRKAMIDFKPDHNYFNGLNITVKINHKDFGNNGIYEFLVSSMDSRVYDSFELHSQFKPIIAWLDKRPELLI